MRQSDVRGGRLRVEELEGRFAPSTAQLLPGGILSVTGTADRDLIRVALDAGASQFVVLDRDLETARFDTAAVTSIVLSGGAGDDSLAIDNAVTVPAVIDGSDGNDVLRAGGG